MNEQKIASIGRSDFHKIKPDGIVGESMSGTLTIFKGFHYWGRTAEDPVTDTCVAEDLDSVLGVFLEVSEDCITSKAVVNIVDRGFKPWHVCNTIDDLLEIKHI